MLQAQWKQIGVNVQIVQSSNYVTDLYQDHKAAMGLNPSGLPGIEKLTTQFIPGSIGDICNYNNSTLNAITNQIQALPPTSPKLKSEWIAAQDFIIKNALGFYVVYSPNVEGASKSVKNLQIVPYVGEPINFLGDFSIGLRPGDRAAVSAVVMDGGEDGLTTILHSQPAVNAVQMALHRSSADGELISDCGIRTPLHQQQKDICLSGRETQLPHQG